jgi:ketosteroid isomerase-like protein
MATTSVQEGAIQAFEQRWAAAENHGDADELNEVLDSSFTCVGPAGFVITREQYLAVRRSSDLKSQEFAWEDVRIRQYGRVAVVIATQSQRSSFQGRDASGRFRATQVLTSRGDTWSAVSLHLSPITPAPRWIIGVLQAAPPAQG